MDRFVKRFQGVRQSVVTTVVFRLLLSFYHVVFILFSTVLYQNMLLTTWIRRSTI
jgi:hypothetical protein